MDVKSFMLGYKAGASKGGGNVSQAELEAAIKAVVPGWALAETKPTYTAPEVGLGKVDNERQYSADNPPPYPVTSVNGQVGAVNLPIPSEAADVGADPVGTAEAKLKAHNTDNDAHEYIQQRIDALRTLIENFLDISDESFDQLSEILRDIRANTSALELLGTNKVDKTAISTSMTDSNPEHVASMTLIVALDNALTVAEQAIEDLKTNKQTAEQVSAAINNALSGYLTSVKAAELYQPKGDYLTPEAGDARYAKPSDIPTVPQTLPNPYALNILGKAYNGSSAVSLTVDELIEAIKTASGGVIAWIGDDNNIYLAGNLADGTYKAYFEVDGEYIEIGELTKGEEETPETKTYTITWANYDGTVLETDTVTEGETPTYEGATPTRAADDQYTYTFKGWDKTVVAATADTTYTAQYTQTAIETEPSYTNLLPLSTDASGNPYNGGQGWKTGYRLNSSGAEAALAGIEVTGFMPLKYEDTVYIKNITDDGTHVIALYDSTYAKLATMQFSTVFGAPSGELASKKINGYVSTQVEQAGENIAYMRISANEITANSIVTVNENIE